MKLYRPNKHRNQLSDQVEHVLRLMEDMRPQDGHLVLTVWVSSSALSEEDRERLHRHLIDAHGAVTVLTMGLGQAKPQALP